MLNRSTFSGDFGGCDLGAEVLSSRTNEQLNFARFGETSLHDIPH
jgi:hypothetical protein